MVTEDQVHNAISVILNDRANYSKTLNWAVDYCRAGMTMGGHDLKVQCLYILSNISRWRHPEAKSVRDTLKAYSK